MATSGNLFSTKDSRGYQIRLYWYENIVNNSDLRKNIGFELYLRSTRDNFWFTDFTLDAFVKVDGTNDPQVTIIDERKQYSIADPNSSFSEVKIGSATRSFQHSSDGTCTVAVDSELFATASPSTYTFIPTGTLSINADIELEPFDVTPPTPDPTFSGSLRNGTAGVEYEDTLTVTDTTSVTASGFPPGIGFSFNSSLQRITVEGTPTSTGTYTPSITATGPEGGTTTYNNDSITIFAPSISFSGSFDNAEQNIFYSDSITIFNADSASASGLGSNLSGNFNGSTFTVSGTPNSSGNESFTINASNVYGASSSNSYTIYIAPPANPTWTDKLLAPFYVGIPYSDTVSANNANSINLTGTLPQGLSVSQTSSSLTISGTPEQKDTELEMDTYSFTITVQGDPGTTSISESYSIPLRFPGARQTTSNTWEDLRTARRFFDGQWLPINTRLKRFNGSTWQDIDPV